MNILFIHGNFPAQFRDLATRLSAQSSHDVRFLTARDDAERFRIPNLKLHIHNDCQSSPGLDPLLQINDELTNRALLIQKEVLGLIASGFNPRLIFFHAGRGIGLLLRQLCPNACLIGYFEWYFSDESSFVLLGSNSLTARNYVSLRNQSILSELINCSTAVIPTTWQASQFPALVRDKLNVIFDGIDTDFYKPETHEFRFSSLVIKGESASLQLSENDLLLTYMTRGMEPLRGFPEFMRALPSLLSKLPQLKVLIAGRDRSAYGAPPPDHDGSWKKKLLDELGEFSGFDRVYFTGLLPPSQYRLALARTNLHVYFTRPYVTSWSLFESVAMSAPIFTNRSEATTALFPFLDEYACSLDDSPADISAQIYRLLIRKRSEYQFFALPDQFTIHRSRELWQSLVNHALTL